MYIINLALLSEAESKKRKGMERYRSGHNEAVLKTVCPQGRVGSNPTLSVQKAHSVQEEKVSLIGEVPKLAEGAPLERE